MDRDLYKKILEDHRELAALPQTLAEVLRVIKDENSSATDLADVLRRDPSLTTKMLRVVNSPLYGAGREITTMTQAVMTLGHRAVSALALSTSIYHIAGKWDTTIDRTRFWRHSLEVAIACREIAEAIRYNCAEEAFIAGLIHDIGLLVLERSFSEKFARVWLEAERGESIFEQEERVWETNHARIGRFLLEQWNLPEVICQAVGYYHNQFSPGNNEPEFRLPQIVALADIISRFSITKAQPNLSLEQDYREILCTNLKLDPHRLVEIEKTLFGKTVQEASFLEIEIGSPNDLMIEANQLLYDQYLTVEKLLTENNQLHEQIARDKLHKAALETLNTITATFNHYINNASATILGRAQLVEVAISKGQVKDPEGTVDMSMQVIVNGVSTIKAVMEELKNLTSFDTIVYHDDTYVIDIEKKIKKQLESINQIKPVLS